MARWLRHAPLMALAVCTACTTGPAASPSSAFEVTVLESGFDACALLDSATVEAVTGESIHDASEHLTAAPIADVRDCVFFWGDAVVVSLSVRQVSTSTAEGEGLVADLIEGYPPDAEVVAGDLADGVPASEFGYCYGIGSCFSSLAFSAEPYFIIVTIPRAFGDVRDAESLAHAVLQRLSGS